MASPLATRVSKTIKERKLFRQGCRTVLVALSGGADSVALLLVLQELGYETVAAHCNFHLRGAESDQDAAFVTDLCRKLGVQLHQTDFDTIAYARQQSLSIEMAARELRYGWFARLQQDLDIENVTVAHHADDNAETMVLNLCRGTGISGLCGMPYKREDGVVRPLLDASRKEIEEYLAERKVSYCTDSTNTDTRLRRNLIRHRIMPLLRELNPSVDEALARTRENLEGVAACYAQALEPLRQELHASGKINIQTIQSSPAPFTILYDLLHPFGFNRSQIREMATAMDKAPGATFYSPTLRLIHERKALALLPLASDPSGKEYYQLNLADDKLDLPDGKRLTWRKGTPSELHLKSLHRPNKQLLLSAKAVEMMGTLILRHPQHGDYIYPYGLKGQKTVSRFLIDRRIARSRREQTWLLCHDEDVLWIPEHGADRRFALDALHPSEEYILFSFCP